ncbi:Shikimate dehydrogenase [Pseudobythopirellula maris]|uniref:Multifunctional fusion protein n=1 Tax=Pseudobythopirellula maris TaxID=2527991 RepID=A0A5C5ZI15_9BACT|nr:shikimate dehydrogenase [Pseudobythopirellula maris]TWT86828.1 Shikimate dehydrogenase [Pseudobythopirellula maris]
MICVSIGRSRHKHMLAEHRHLVDQGAQLVELRLDYLSTRVNIARLLADRPCPVIVTCRREADGGKYTGTEEHRLTLLREAIVAGVEYIDLEDDIASQVPRFGKTKRIISHHNFRNTPENLDELHAELAGLDADIVKIATMAQKTRDNTRVLELIKKHDKPTVAMCMGDIGTPSRILGAKFGAPFTYATFHHERALAPGQLSFQQMTEIFHYEKINADTDLYGVIADPVGHSLSPLIHNAQLREHDLNSVYLPFRVPVDSLADFVEDVPRLGIKGLSVTIPHKEAIARHLTKVDPAAKGIGAVNTVVFRDGQVIGYNTDYKGAMDCLEKVLGHDSAEKPDAPSPLAGRRALVLGAGGAGRAVVYGLKKRGAAITIASRTKARSEKLAKEFECRAVDWNARHNAAPEVLVNCSPIGMHPNVDETPFSKAYLRPGMIVFDTVYNPESTLLVKEAREHGCRVATGVEMFVNQAALQYKLFTGQEASKELMRDTIKRAIGPVKF